jgi:EmrB/QacA subfamily drug resistance transporter
VSATTVPPPAGPTEPVGVEHDPRRRRLIVIAMCTALTAVIASMSGLNVAQGELAADLGASQGDLLWIINGYTIALAALLLPIGAIGDRWGRKRVLLGGLVLFTVASAASSFAGSVDQLLATRVLAGIAAAMIMPVTLSVITSTFPAEERDRAIGIWAGFAGAGGILGLFTSSVVVDNATWPWVFVAPIVAALVSLALSIAVVPSVQEAPEGRFDVLGSILSALAVGSIVFAVHEGPEAGWSDPLTLVFLLGGLGAGAAFAAWELRQPHPLLDLRVFRNRTLTVGSLSLLLVFALMMGLFLVLVQFLQAVLGYSAVTASLGLMPMAAVLMPLSAVAPVLAQRVGLRPMFVGGSAAIAVGLALMASMASIDGGYLSVLPGLLVLAVGVGLTQTPATSAITGSLPPEDQGVASALNDTVREFGGALGVALIGSVLSAGYRSGVADLTAGLPGPAAEAVESGIGGAVAAAAQVGPAADPALAQARQAFVDGFGQSMWVAAGLAVVAAVVALVGLPRRTAAVDGSSDVEGGAAGGSPTSSTGDEAVLVATVD